MPQPKKTMSVFTSISGTGRRLKRWEKENLLTNEQASSILEFEKHNQGQRFFRSLVGLAIFAIGVGILSIVAANWVHLSGSAKIGLHFLLNIGAAISIWKFAKADKGILREGATLLFFALNMTMIALIGQVFQLSGNYAAAFSLWVLISSPALFVYGKTAMNAVPWVMAFLAAVFFILLEITSFWHHDLTGFLIFLAAGLYIPLLLMAAGLNKTICTLRIDWARAFTRLSMLILTAQGTLGSLLWYSDTNHDLRDLFTSAGSFELGYAAMLAIIFSALASVYTYEALKMRQGHKITDRSGIIFIIGSLISATLPIALLTGEIDFIAAIHFVAYWCFVGWIGNRMGFTQLISISITMITLRIIIVYFELFGNLLTTGFGLIFSGVLMLGILKAAMAFKKKITARSAGESNDKR